MLAYSLGRKDEGPNEALANLIVQRNDREAVDYLLDFIQDKDKNIHNDAIKVIYEIGEKKPELISHAFGRFIDLLSHKNNRLQWGAMAAIDAIAEVVPSATYQHLAAILDSAEKGSVITRDHTVNILIKLTRQKSFETDAMSLLLEQIERAPENQLPMYVERAYEGIPNHLFLPLLELIKSRLPDVEKESKRKRLEKVIRKIEKSL